MIKIHPPIFTPTGDNCIDYLTGDVCQFHPKQFYGKCALFKNKLTSFRDSERRLNLKKCPDCLRAMQAEREKE